MIERLHFDAILGQLVGFQILEGLFRHPGENAGIPARTEMPPFQDQFKVGEHLPGPQDADRLLAYREPAARRTTLRRGAQVATIVVAVAPDVVPGSVRVHVGRQSLTAAVGPIVPGTTKTLVIPLRSRHTVVRLRAAGERTGGRRRIDRDRLIFERSQQ